MIEEFDELDDDELDRLSQALKSGRLAPPLSPVSLRRLVPGRLAPAIAAKAGALFEGGLSPDHLALALDAIRRARAAGGSSGPAIELVWTGPEAEGARNRDTRVVVRDLFASARAEVLVVGYVVYQGDFVFGDLASRMDADPALSVRMFLDVGRKRGDAAPAEEIIARFARRFAREVWPGRRLPGLYYDPRSTDVDPSQRSSLHAKCVVVDRERSLVSSANFTEAAQIRNLEVGVLIRSRDFARRLAHHFESLATMGLLRPIPLPDR